MGNSIQHQDYDVPHFLIGGKNLGLVANRHLAYEHNDHHRQPLVSVLELYGIKRTRGRQHRSIAEIVVIEDESFTNSRLPRLVWTACAVLGGVISRLTRCYFNVARRLRR
jgi:hypothetical protein